MNDENLDQPGHSPDPVSIDGAIAQQAIQETAAELPEAILAVDEPKPKPSLQKLALLALAVVLVILAVVLLVLKASGALDPTVDPESVQSTKEVKTGTTGSYLPVTDDTNQYEGKQIKDEDLLQDLNQKLAVLHSVKQTKQYFELVTLESFESRLYSNTLSEDDQTYLLLHHLDYYEQQFKSVQDATAARAAYAYLSGNECTNDFCQVTGQINVNTVQQRYQALFGTSALRSNVAMICSRYLYDVSTGLYYKFQEGGCGGVRSYTNAFYLEAYTQKDAKAYVYVRAGIRASVADAEGVWGTQCVILHDLGYDQAQADQATATNCTENPVITADNHQDFAQYRLVFQRDDADNYYFATVEQL